MPLYTWENQVSIFIQIFPNFFWNPRIYFDIFFNSFFRISDWVDLCNFTRNWWIQLYWIFLIFGAFWNTLTILLFYFLFHRLLLLIELIYQMHNLQQVLDGLPCEISRTGVVFPFDEITCSSKCLFLNNLCFTLLSIY